MALRDPEQAAYWEVRRTGALEGPRSGCIRKRCAGLFHECQLMHHRTMGFGRRRNGSGPLSDGRNNHLHDRTHACPCLSCPSCPYLSCPSYPSCLSCTRPPLPHHPRHTPCSFCPSCPSSASGVVRPRRDLVAGIACPLSLHLQALGSWQ
jgi:hypothetical protein